MFEFSDTTTAELEKLNSGGKEVVNPYITVESLEQVCKDDESLRDLLKETLEYCARYTESVFEFNQVLLKGDEAKTSDELVEVDNKRKRVHDATIDSVNVLARNLAQRDKDASWIRQMVAGGRPAYTKFALLVALELMTNAR